LDLVRVSEEFELSEFELSDFELAGDYCINISDMNIDEKLTWDAHIDSICSKVSAEIGAMKRIKPFVPPATLQTIYKALIQPSLTKISHNISYMKISYMKSLYGIETNFIYEMLCENFIYEIFH
jgi:hypothetical protein